MRTVATMMLAGMALVMATPALAGRDETLMQIAHQAMVKQRAAQSMQAQKAQPVGLAGAKGQAGRLGPTSGRPTQRAGRLFGEHP